MAGDDVKMLIESAAPELKQKLFQGAGFTLDEACRIVSAFMFDRYGVSNYNCGTAVQTALESYFDAQPELQRDGAALAWQPLGLGFQLKRSINAGKSGASAGGIG